MLMEVVWLVSIWSRDVLDNGVRYSNIMCFV